MKTLTLIKSNYSFLTVSQLGTDMVIDKAEIRFNRAAASLAGLDWPVDVSRGGELALTVSWTSRDVAATVLNGGWYAILTVSAGHDEGLPTEVSDSLYLDNCQLRSVSVREYPISPESWLVRGTLTFTFQSRVYPGDDLGGSPFRSNADRGFYFKP